MRNIAGKRGLIKSISDSEEIAASQPMARQGLAATDELTVFPCLVD